MFRYIPLFVQTTWFLIGRAANQAPISEISPRYIGTGLVIRITNSNIYTIVDNQNIIIRIATSFDSKYADTITAEMESSAMARGTGIAKRSPEYISQKIEEGKAVIAVTEEGDWVGFCYIETWEGEYVANSGL
ncbi:MAG TPA: hypothetical protein VGO09_04820, partial [Flavisolibacter sp.]|nr:hypothetical protein [Flavisolibacter sp.]